MSLLVDVITHDLGNGPTIRVRFIEVLEIFIAKEIFGDIANSAQGAVDSNDGVIVLREELPDAVEDDRQPQDTQSEPGTRCKIDRRDRHEQHDVQEIEYFL